MRMKELPKIDMPRERLLKYGKEKIADHELLAIMLGSGIKDTNVVELARKIIQVSCRIGFSKITIDDLCKIKGLGKTRASQVISIYELGIRVHSRTTVHVMSAEDVWKLCVDIRDSKREHFLVFYLNSQDELIERQVVSIGTLTASLVHPREVFEPALSLHAASIIVAHNHPSGRVEASQEDREVTRRLKSAGSLLGVPLKDHVLVTRHEYISFRSTGML